LLLASNADIQVANDKLAEVRVQLRESQETMSVQAPSLRTSSTSTTTTTSATTRLSA
jgi:hypothetical protein